MTDTPEPLPGLPTPAEEPRELTQAEVVTLNLQVSINQLCAQLQQDSPGINQADAAGIVGEIVAKQLGTIMAPGAARLGLLVAFEQTHEEPMNFIRINQAKDALTKLADRRRVRDRKTEGGIIIPGKD
jgi:hypothetical protein